MNSQNLTTSVAGKTEVGDFTAQSDPFLDRLVGSSNQHNVMVNGITFICLVTDCTTQPGSEGSVICLTIYLLLDSGVIAWLLVRLVCNPGLGEISFIVISIFLYPCVDLWRLLGPSNGTRFACMVGLFRRILFS